MSENSFPVIIDGQAVMVQPRTPAYEVLKAKENPEIIGVLVNNCVCGLNVPLITTVKLTPILRHQHDGVKILNRTCSFILESILEEHYPKLHFQIGQTIGDGIFYELLDYQGQEPNLDTITDELNQLLQKLIDDNLPISTTLSNVDSAYLQLNDRRGSVLRLLDTWPYNYVAINSLGNFSTICYEPVAPATGYCNGMVIMPYPRGFILKPRKEIEVPAPEHSNRLMDAYRENRTWNRMINVATVADLNEAILTGRISEVIRVQEGLHERKIVRIADEIGAHRDTLRLICIAGPSSSGKTTFVQRLSVQLQVMGIDPVIISLDNYYRDRAECPRDEDGKMDFEDLNALDIPLLTKDLKAIVSGEEIRVPRFDFTKSARVPESQFEPLRLKKNQMLLIEGIHGLNPTITDAVPAEARYRIFVSALTQLIVDEHTRIPTSDGRLLRRIVRDRRYRGTLASGTIEMWPSVRRGEVKWIFPFQEQCDAMFNSALVYEPAILKMYAMRYLMEVPREDPTRVHAQSLLSFLDLFVPLEPDLVPNNSVIREFIGGSIFTY